MNLELLEQARKERGVMYKFLAEKTGMNPSLFCRRIHGKGVFTVDEAKNIAVALRLSHREVNDIFFDGQLPEAQSKGTIKNRN